MTTKRTSLTVVDATSLKMSLGTIGDRVRTQDLQITKHGTPQAVVISVDRYERLSRLEPVDVSSLQALQDEFDRMLAKMQSPQQGTAMNRLMDADEDDITGFLGKHYAANPVPAMADQARVEAKKPRPSKGNPPVIQVHLASGRTVIRKFVDRDGGIFTETKKLKPLVDRKADAQPIAKAIKASLKKAAK